MNDRRHQAYYPASHNLSASYSSGSGTSQTSYVPETTHYSQSTSSTSYGYPQSSVDEYRGRYYGTSAAANSREDSQLSIGYPSSYPPFNQSAPIYASRPPHPSSSSHSRSHSQTSGMPYPQTGRTYPSSSHGNYDYSVSYDMQYPASPPRPFACDQCALSFNRQHDLKRHRETHSGEKPFHCNGGCGKTFTRKDALKRHQLVKHCGTTETDASA